MRSGANVVSEISAGGVDYALRAANGRQGLERLAEEPRPDLVITDFMMPILDDASFLQAMRGTEAQRDIPCIVISSMPEANVRARIDGYAAFVRKPFQLTEMMRMVTAILGRETQRVREWASRDVFLTATSDMFRFPVTLNAVARTSRNLFGIKDAEH
jgi:CheY-like chemotaxis protein